MATKKKPSAKQLAARKKFVAAVKSGKFQKKKKVIKRTTIKKRKKASKKRVVKKKVIGITLSQAKAIAMDWHGGQGSPLYSFGSTGSVNDKAKLISEIDENMRMASAQQKSKLSKLKTFVRNK